MQPFESVYWEEDGDWLGYLKEYPDHWTQGESLDDLLEHLHDFHGDIAQICKPINDS